MTKRWLERSIGAYSKVPDEHGAYMIQEELKLKPIELDLLKKIFDFNPITNDDVDMYDCYQILDKHAKALQPYVIDGIIDLDKYSYQLECFEFTEK